MPQRPIVSPIIGNRLAVPKLQIVRRMVHEWIQDPGPMPVKFVPCEGVLTR